MDGGLPFWDLPVSVACLISLKEAGALKRH
jgi:hypothetical protein